MSKGDSRRGPITAGELMERLANDTEYQRIVADQNRFCQVRIDQNFRDMAPVVAELRAAGYVIDNISYLAFFEDRSRAMPILRPSACFAATCCINFLSTRHTACKKGSLSVRAQLLASAA